MTPVQALINLKLVNALHKKLRELGYGVGERKDGQKLYLTVSSSLKPDECIPLNLSHIAIPINVAEDLIEKGKYICLARVLELLDPLVYHQLTYNYDISYTQHMLKDVLEKIADDEKNGDYSHIQEYADEIGRLFGKELS